ncbi:MAG: sulfotransferase [Bacteroidales bacterium]|nr:sulfotransferase [Bacteroidales bacterium]
MRQKRFSFPVTTLIGTSLKNFVLICKGHTIGKKYYVKLMLTFLVSGIFGIFSFFEWLIWRRRLARFKPTEQPVFIIGFWRSGTTLLHNLLCQDPRSAYTTTFQTVFPHLTLTQSWWLKPLANTLLPSGRPFDNVSWRMDSPQEEEFGLMNLQPDSIYKFFLFPEDFDDIVEQELFTANLPGGELKYWKKRYREMYAKAVFNTGGSRYISKNPCNLTRLGLLVEMYPDAKFIFIHRDPYEVVESLYRFILGIFPGVQLQDVPADFTREKVAFLYGKIIRTYLQDRNLIDPQNLIELRMEDLMEDTAGIIRNIYERFHYDGIDDLSPTLEQYIAGENYPGHEPYAIEAETIRLVNHHMGDLVSYLGYKTKSRFSL